MAPDEGWAAGRCRLPFRTNARDTISMIEARRPHKLWGSALPCSQGGGPLSGQNMLDRPTVPYTEPPEVPIEDQALLDAYSRAVIDVVDRLGPAVPMNPKLHALTAKS